MALVTCFCLNVNVYITNSVWQQYPVPPKDLFSEECKDVISGRDGLLYEVNLDVAGIVVELKALVCCRQVEDWIITSCSNCHTDVYVRHVIKPGRILLTSGLLCDKKEIERIKQLDNFSSIFNILVAPVQEENMDVVRRKRVTSMSFGYEDPDMKSIHEQLKRYLKVEEDAMEKRIRCYEKEQKEVFLSLQNKAHDDRRLLFMTISKARENTMSYKSEDVEMVEHTSVPTDFDHNRVAIRKNSPDDNLKTSKVAITYEDDSLNKISGYKESLEDSLFALEGFDEEQSYEDIIDADTVEYAFSQSDDEFSTDDSSFGDISAVNRMKLASSVPVGIPLFRKPSNGTDSCAENNENAFDVGNSIRQLALSIQDTGMFGDLPRPRIMNNTLMTQALNFTKEQC